MLCKVSVCSMLQQEVMAGLFGIEMLKCWIEFLMKKVWFLLATLSDCAVFLVEIYRCKDQRFLGAASNRIFSINVVLLYPFKLIYQLIFLLIRNETF